MNNDFVYMTFINHVLKDKEYLILLCLKDLCHEHKEEIDSLYEMGIVSLYYAYKLYHTNVTNFDFLAYRFIMLVMLDYIKQDMIQ